MSRETTAVPLLRSFGQHASDAGVTGANPSAPVAKTSKDPHRDAQLVSVERQRSAGLDCFGHHQLRVAVGGACSRWKLDDIAARCSFQCAAALTKTQGGWKKDFVSGRRNGPRNTARVGALRAVSARSKSVERSTVFPEKVYRPTPNQQPRPEVAHRRILAASGLSRNSNARAVSPRLRLLMSQYADGGSR